MNVSASVYRADGVETYEDAVAATSADGQTWIHVENPTAQDLSELTEACGIHDLAIEDIGLDDSRPKTEEYETHTFVLLKTAQLRAGDVVFDKEVRVNPVGFFIGEDWLVTMADSDVDIVDTESRRLAGREAYVSERGVDFIAYRIMDRIVDDYFDLLDDIETDIETIEESVLGEIDPNLLERINGVRRDLLAFRKLTWPTREALGTLARGDVVHVQEQNEKYFRDVSDHLVQQVDLIETYRELTSGSRDIYLNTVSQSTNEVMKTLTVVATIFIPLTFVAGVYGMNFSETPYAMPELTWLYGYPATMIGMSAIAAIMMYHFRQEGWL